MALYNIADDVRNVMLPIVEIVPDVFRPRGVGSRSPNATDVLVDQAEQIVRASRGSSVFVDLCQIAEVCEVADGKEPLEVLAREFRDPTQGTFFRQPSALIPVVHLSDKPERLRAARAACFVDRNGLCLRLDRTHLRVNAKVMSVRLRQFVSRMAVSFSDVDLVVDVGHIQDADVSEFDGVLLGKDGIWRAGWRSVILLSGAFPRYLTMALTGHGKNTQYTLPRLDWRAGLSMMKRGRELGIPVSFGDFTIQHAVLEPSPAGANFSASIRYAADDCWVIMRGEGVLNPHGPGYSQWPAQAQLLVRREEFLGAAYSLGDDYIKQMADQHADTGNATTWLTAGISHHLTLASRQVARYAVEPIAVEGDEDRAASMK